VALFCEVGANHNIRPNYHPPVTSFFDNPSLFVHLTTEAIEQAAKDAAHVSPDNPLLPPVKIIKANDPAGLRALGIGVVGGSRKPYIE
jgi:hypothetical protein